MPQIIETTCNRLFRVTDATAFEGDRPGCLAHVYAAIEVKRAARGLFVPKVRARQELVRREGCRVVAEAV